MPRASGSLTPSHAAAGAAVSFVVLFGFRHSDDVARIARAQRARRVRACASPSLKRLRHATCPAGRSPSLTSDLYLSYP